MPHVPGLRSCYAKVGRLVYFGRMLDKIRLQAAGKLPVAYAANLGEAKPIFFDARTCLFLGIAYVRASLSNGLDRRPARISSREKWRRAASMRPAPSSFNSNRPCGKAGEWREG